MEKGVIIQLQQIRIVVVVFFFFNLWVVKKVVGLFTLKKAKL